MVPQPKKDKPWIVTATGCVAVDASLNRFANTWPAWVFIALWIAAAISLLVWGVKVGKASVIKQKFSDAPAFYVIALLVITPFGLDATIALYSRLKSKDTQTPTQTASTTSNVPIQQQPRMPQVITSPSESKPVTNHPAAPRPRPKILPTPEVSIAVPSTTAPQSVPTQPTYGSPTCVGSACAQGPGAQATFNQFGAPKFLLSDAERDGIRDAMKPFSGNTISISGHDPTPDLTEFTEKLSDALRMAGMTVRGPQFGTFHLGHIILPGLTICWSKDMTATRNSLVKALSDQHVANLPIHGEMSESLSPGSINVLIAPNR